MYAIKTEQTALVGHSNQFFEITFGQSSKQFVEKTFSLFTNFGEIAVSVDYWYSKNKV